MRRVLRKVVERDLDGMGDLSTLEDPAAVNEIIQGHLELCGEPQQLWGGFWNVEVVLARYPLFQLTSANVSNYLK